MSDEFNTLGSPARTVELENVLYVIRRHLLLIAALVAVAMAAAFLYVSSVAPEYRTRATMVLSPSAVRINQISSEVEAVEANRAFVETELDVLRSRDFAARLGRRLDLFDNPNFFPRVNPDTGVVIDEVTHTESVIDRVLQSYAVFRSGESLAIEVIGTSTDPRLAAAFANGVIGLYIDDAVEEKQSGIRDSIEIFTRRVEAQGEALTQSEVELADLIRGNNLDDVEESDRLRSDVERLSAILAISESQGVTDERREQYTSELEAAQAELRERTRLELTLKGKEREIEVQRNTYQAHIDQLNELQLQLDLVGQGTRQVSVARVPAQPAWPNKRLAVVTAGLVAATLGFLFAFVREGLNRRIRSEAHVLNATGLKNLGYIPRVGRGIGRSFNPLEHVRENPYDPFAETVRGLITLWSGRGDNKVLMVASGLPGEGKSSVAVALAAVSAIDGTRTLLIDLDIHRHGATRLLDAAPTDASLAGVIDGTIPPQQVFVRGERFENLDLISVKHRSKSSPEAMSHRLLRLKKQLANAYDLVIVDTPPALVMDDACRHAALADEAIIVVHWGHTTTLTLSDTVNRLTRGGIDVFATVVNNVDVKKHQRYGYGGYLGAYRYGYSYSKG